jgi:hypothetical protein
MTRFSSRSVRSTTGLAAGVAAFALLAVAGCADRHIGRKCDLQLDGGTGDVMATNIAVNTEALECPSRVCIQPNQAKSTDTGSLCTDECSSDDDCANGEKRDKSDPNDKRCQSGFACRVIIPNLPNVNLACKKVCVCKDFLGNETPTPQGC